MTIWLIDWWQSVEVGLRLNPLWSFLVDCRHFGGCFPLFSPPPSPAPAPAAWRAHSVFSVILIVCVCVCVCVCVMTAVFGAAEMWSHGRLQRRQLSRCAGSPVWPAMCHCYVVHIGPGTSRTSPWLSGQGPGRSGSSSSHDGLARSWCQGHTRWAVGGDRRCSLCAVAVDVPRLLVCCLTLDIDCSSEYTHVELCCNVGNMFYCEMVQQVNISHATAQKQLITVDVRYIHWCG